MASLTQVFPTDLDPLAAQMLIALSFGTSFITVTLGIGGGAVLLAVMASIMPPAALIPVHGVIQLGSNAFRMLLMRGHIHWPPVFAFAMGAILGVGLGGAIAVDLPQGAVLIGVGLFVIFTVAARPPRWIARSAGIAGVVSSFLTMFFGATGPFVAGYVKALDLGRDNHIATHALLMTLQHGLKIAMFGALGFAFVPWLPFVGLMIASGFLGTFVGRHVLFRIPEEVFRKILNTMLFLIALRLIWQGVVLLSP